MMPEVAQRLAHVYWLGGSPCAGKTSIAQRLAHQYDLHLYQCDFLFPAHQARAQPDQQPTLLRLASLTCNEIWLPPVAEQVARVQAIYSEEFAMIVEDLLALPKTKPILAEGAALLPACVRPWLTEDHRALWITPAPLFQRTHYAQRIWVAEVLRNCTDPAQAFENWMARDEAFARWIEAGATARGLSWLQVDGDQSIDMTVTWVAQRFQLGRFTNC